MPLFLFSFSLVIACHIGSVRSFMPGARARLQFIIIHAVWHFRDWCCRAKKLTTDVTVATPAHMTAVIGATLHQIHAEKRDCGLTRELVRESSAVPTAYPGPRHSKGSFCSVISLSARQSCGECLDMQGEMLSSGGGRNQCAEKVPDLSVRSMHLSVIRCQWTNTISI